MKKEYKNSSPAELVISKERLMEYGIQVTDIREQLRNAAILSAQQYSDDDDLELTPRI